MSKGLVAGSSICILTPLPGGIFFIKACHEVYWPRRAVFISTGFLGMPLLQPETALLMKKVK